MREKKERRRIPWIIEEIHNASWLHGWLFMVASLLLTAILFTMLLVGFYRGSFGVQFGESTRGTVNWDWWNYMAFIAGIVLSMTVSILLALHSVVKLSELCVRAWCYREWKRIMGERFVPGRIEPCLEKLVREITSDASRIRGDVSKKNDPQFLFWRALEMVWLMEYRTKHSTFKDYAREVAK